MLLIVNTLRYHGMVTWLSARIALLDSAAGYTGNMCDPGNYTLAPDRDRACHPDNNFFRSGTISAASSLPGNIISILFVDMVGRKTLSGQLFRLTFNI